MYTLTAVCISVLDGLIMNKEKNILVLLRLISFKHTRRFKLFSKVPIFFVVVVIGGGGGFFFLTTKTRTSP